MAFYSILSSSPNCEIIFISKIRVKASDSRSRKLSKMRTKILITVVKYIRNALQISMTEV